MPRQKAVLPVLNCAGTGVDETAVNVAVEVLLPGIGSLVLLLTDAVLLMTELTATPLLTETVTRKLTECPAGKVAMVSLS